MDKKAGDLVVGLRSCPDDEVSDFGYVKCQTDPVSSVHACTAEQDDREVSTNSAVSVKPLELPLTLEPVRRPLDGCRRAKCMKRLIAMCAN